ncbi:MAG: hypothetical protein IT464_14765 [Planctomycetes bacterium]|nr:hypothetical protein [Planctomycetota bacterium]
MRSFTLDWKGWWLLRTPLSDVPELGAKTAVYAVMAAKLQKVGNGVGSSARELVMFGVHKGEVSIHDYLEKLQKMSLGVFALNRCREIRKSPIVYSAALPDDIDLGELAAILALLYEANPFAPKHHAMPKPYHGGQFLIKNVGKNPGLPEEIFRGTHGPISKDGDATVDGEADAAMAQAISAEAAITRRMTPEEMELRGIATEKVARPGAHIPTERVDKPPRLVETAKIGKDDIAHGLATEKVDKPAVHAEAHHKTEFVPKPGDLPQSRPVEPADEDEPSVLDEAGREAS